MKYKVATRSPLYKLSHQKKVIFPITDVGVGQVIVEGADERDEPRKQRYVWVIRTAGFILPVHRIGLLHWLPGEPDWTLPAE
jgi:hypothetical protein